MARYALGGALLLLAVSCGPPPLWNNQGPLPPLRRTDAAHHQAGSTACLPATLPSPTEEKPKPPPLSPSFEEVEQAILIFQHQRKPDTPANDTAWEPFIETVLAYLKQPPERLRFSPLIRARVAAEFELDLERHKVKGVSPRLERSVSSMLLRIDRKMRALRTRREGSLSSLPPPEAGKLGWPLSCGLVSSRFGPRENPLRPNRRHFHSGLDLAAPPHEPVYAAAPGRVVFASWAGKAGRMVRIQHQGKLETVYAHLATILVKEEQEVFRGEVIGLLGCSGRTTGHHLHFALYRGDQAIDPLDHLQAVPMSFSDSTPAPVFGCQELP